MSLAEKYLPNYTVEDYLLWEGDWEGIPFAMAPSPVWKYQRVVSLLVRTIDEQFENCPENYRVSQEVDWTINYSTVVRPDVVVVCGEVEDFIKTTPNHSKSYL